MTSVPWPCEMLNRGTGSGVYGNSVYYLGNFFVSLKFSKEKSYQKCKKAQYKTGMSKATVIEVELQGLES